MGSTVAGKGKAIMGMQMGVPETDLRFTVSNPPVQDCWHI